MINASLSLTPFGTIRVTVAGLPPGTVRAKTGWIDEVYSLAGFMNTQDGGQITFAFFVVGKVSLPNRDVLDSIVTSTSQCGGQLANW